MLTRYDKLMAKAVKLANQDMILPLDEIRLSADLAALPDKTEVTARLIREYFPHENLHLRRIAINAVRRAQSFAVPHLQEALTQCLYDTEAWVRYDAAWAIGEAHFDSPEIREQLSRLAGDIDPQEGERRVKATPSNAALQAQYRAWQTLEALRTK